MTLEEVMAKLESLGNSATKSTYIKHGAKEPLFGVKVGDLKPLQKKIKKDHELSLALFDTGNADARYLAGLIADESKMTRKDLKRWAKAADWSMLSESTVAWVASESRYGWDLGLEWIESNKENIASAGWSTLSNFISITPDEDLDVSRLGELLDHIAETIHDQPNRVRYAMNGFVIGAGSFVPALTAKAKQAARKIGKVRVNMGETACKVPDALPYIEKGESMNRPGKKRKLARCWAAPALSALSAWAAAW
jgi:3-methyladenine DNA glycosylase AlkD